jgi:hypothetical protein
MVMAMIPMMMAMATVMVMPIALDKFTALALCTTALNMTISGPFMVHGGLYSPNLPRLEERTRLMM